MPIPLPDCPPTQIEPGITLGIVGGLPEINLRLTDIPLNGGMRNLARVVAQIDGKEVWAYLQYNADRQQIVMRVCRASAGSDRSDVVRPVAFRPWYRSAPKATPSKGSTPKGA